MTDDANERSAFRRVPVDYREAAEIQERLVKLRQAGDIGDTLWLLEHAPTITTGVSRGLDHLLLSRHDLENRGYALSLTKRGGDITCHEPGQLVGYPIIQLGPTENERDLHRYLRLLEEMIVLFLAEHGLSAARVDGRTGVWLDATAERAARKIAAIGVRCSRWITSHGFAINIENNLEGFRYIVPCGISDASVTSLKREIGTEALPSWDGMCTRVHQILEEVLGRPLRLLRGREACG